MLQNKYFFIKLILKTICLPLNCVALQFCCKRSKITDRISFILAIFKISFNFFNSFWPTVRIQYDPISHYSPHLNFSFFAVVINSVLRSSQLENVTKNNKMPNVECKFKVVFSSASIQNWKFQIEDQNRWDVRLLWGTIAGKNMIYQAHMFFVGIYSIPLKYFIFISNKKHSVNSIIYDKYIQIYLMKHKWQNFGWS